jgi:hypothetical protein
VKHKVAAKRALAAQIRTAFAELSEPVAGEHVLTDASTRMDHPEGAAIDIAPGAVVLVATQGSGNRLTRADLVLDVVTWVRLAGMTGDEAEDRVAVLGDTIRRSLRDPDVFRNAFRPLIPTGETWTVVSVQIQADEGPIVHQFADVGQAAWVGFEVAISITLGR